MERTRLNDCAADTASASAALVLALCGDSPRSQHGAHQVEGLRGGHRGRERGAGVGQRSVLGGCQRALLRRRRGRRGLRGCAGQDKGAEQQAYATKGIMPACSAVPNNVQVESGIKCRKAASAHMALSQAKVAFWCGLRHKVSAQS